MQLKCLYIIIEESSKRKVKYLSLLDRVSFEISLGKETFKKNVTSGS